MNLSIFIALSLSCASILGGEEDTASAFKTNVHTGLPLPKAPNIGEINSRSSPLPGKKCAKALREVRASESWVVEFIGEMSNRYDAGRPVSASEREYFFQAFDLSKRLKVPISLFTSQHQTIPINLENELKDILLSIQVDVYHLNAVNNVVTGLAAAHVAALVKAIQAVESRCDPPLLPETANEKKEMDELLHQICLRSIQSLDAALGRAVEAFQPIKSSTSTNLLGQIQLLLDGIGTEPKYGGQRFALDRQLISSSSERLALHGAGLHGSDLIMVDDNMAASVAASHLMARAKFFASQCTFI